MFKKFTTKNLIIILVVLGGIVLFNKFYQSKKEESTFEDVFVNIDTALVSDIYIYPQVEKGKEVHFKRNGKTWEVENGKIKTFADTSAIRYLLSQFVDMKSVSLSGQDKSSWKELQVSDSAGTKIKIVVPGQTYEMVVGKINYNQSSGSGSSNIRHAGEEEVYTVQNYLSFAVNQPFNSWRNKTFVNFSKDNWTGFSFSYPGDSSFVLEKTSDTWMVNGEKADSAKVAQYLSQVSSMQSTGFVENYSPASTPVYTVTMKGNNLSSPVIVRAFPADSTQKFILHSSMNPDAYFSESQSHLADRIFVGKKYFEK
jgi:hypothetical protein